MLEKAKSLLIGQLPRPEPAQPIMREHLINFKQAVVYATFLHFFCAERTTGSDFSTWKNNLKNVKLLQFRFVQTARTRKGCETFPNDLKLFKKQEKTRRGDLV